LIKGFKVVTVVHTIVITQIFARRADFEREWGQRSPRVSF
jgi:hypothetical protein